jgi:hypothetical protein
MYLYMFIFIHITKGETMSFSRTTSLATYTVPYRQLHGTNIRSADYQRVICAYFKDNVWHAVNNGYNDLNNVYSVDIEKMTPVQTEVLLSSGTKIRSIIYKTNDRMGWMMIPNGNVANSHQ